MSQHALEQELQKKSQPGASDDSLSPAAQKAYMETLAQTLSISTRANTRPEDMVRKSEVCTHLELDGLREKPFV